MAQCQINCWSFLQQSTISCWREPQAGGQVVPEPWESQTNYGVPRERHTVGRASRDCCRVGGQLPPVGISSTPGFWPDTLKQLFLQDPHIHAPNHCKTSHFIPQPTDEQGSSACLPRGCSHQHPSRQNFLKFYRWTICITGHRKPCIWSWSCIVWQKFTKSWATWGEL